MENSRKNNILILNHFVDSGQMQYHPTLVIVTLVLKNLFRQLQIL